MNLEEIGKIAIENKRLINENKKLINDNFDKIQQNSLAVEILKDYKADSKRWFRILIAVLLMWCVTVVYLVYVLNDVGNYSEDTIDIQGVETIDNSHIKIGDDIWEKSQ